MARDTAGSGLTAAPGWYTAELPNAWAFRIPQMMLLPRAPGPLPIQE